VRYLVRRHGDDWIIVDRQQGFTQLGLFTTEETADWICGLMNADDELGAAGRRSGSRRARH
jgi:hypothetical protein